MNPDIQVIDGAASITKSTDGRIKQFSALVTRFTDTLPADWLTNSAVSERLTYDAVSGDVLVSMSLERYMSELLQDQMLEAAKRYMLDYPFLAGRCELFHLEMANYLHACLSEYDHQEDFHVHFDFFYPGRWHNVSRDVCRRISETIWEGVSRKAGIVDWGDVVKVIDLITSVKGTTTVQVLSNALMGILDKHYIYLAYSRVGQQDACSEPPKYLEEIPDMRAFAAACPNWFETHQYRHEFNFLTHWSYNNLVQTLEKPPTQDK